MRIDKDYRFDTEDGEATLADLFHGRSQLIVYHFMYGPDWDEGCPSCSAVADGFDETHLHLQNHDVAFTAVSRAPLEQAARVPRPHGMELPVGVVGTERLQLRLQRLVHRGVGRERAGRTTSGRSRAGSSIRRTCRSKDPA